MNPYETLGVAADATAQEIRSAFRSQIKAAHPDHGGTDEQFRLLREAYEILKDPERRLLYDRTGNTDAERKVNDMIREVFHSIVLQKNYRGDIVQTCRDKLQYVRAANLAKVTATKQEIRQYELLKDRVVCTGYNAWHEICDNEIERRVATIESLESDNECIELAIEGIGKYGDAQPEISAFISPPTFNVTSWENSI